MTPLRQHDYNAKVSRKNMQLNRARSYYPMFVIEGKSIGEAIRLNAGIDEST